MRLFVLTLLVACNSPSAVPPEQAPAPRAPLALDASVPSIPSAPSVPSLDAAVATVADAGLGVVANRCEPYFSTCSCSEVCGSRPHHDCARACEPQEPSHVRCAIVDGTCQAVEAKQPKSI